MCGEVGQGSADLCALGVQVFGGVGADGDDGLATRRLLNAVEGVAPEPRGLGGLEILTPVAYVVGQVGVVPGMHVAALGRGLKHDREVGTAFADAHLEGWAASMATSYMMVSPLAT